MAMTKRETLSAAVTDVIVQRGNDDVLTGVAGNTGASFSTKSFDILAEKATEVSELRENLVRRDDVPSEVVKLIKRNVAQKLKDEFSKEHADISSQEIDYVVEMQSSKVDFTSLTEDNKYGPHTVNVHDLRDKGLLTQDKIREFADKGMKAELVQALAIEAEIDTDMAYHTLYEAEVPALAVLCRAFHFKRETFGALLQERVRTAGLSTELVMSAMKRYDSLNDETAQRIFRFLKVRLSVSTPH